MKIFYNYFNKNEKIFWIRYCCLFEYCMFFLIMNRMKPLSTAERQKRHREKHKHDIAYITKRREQIRHYFYGYRLRNKNNTKYKEKKKIWIKRYYERMMRNKTRRNHYRCITRRLARKYRAAKKRRMLNASRES